MGTWWRGFCPLGQFCSKGTKPLGRHQDRYKVVKMIANHLYGSNYHEDIDDWEKAMAVANDEAFIREIHDDDDDAEKDDDCHHDDAADNDG